MALSQSDIEFRLSGGAANTAPAASIGGALSAKIVPDNALSYLFPDVGSDASQAGEVRYRCVYVLNTSTTATWQAVTAWIQANTPDADTTVDIGLDPAGVGDGSSTGVAASPANDTTAPSGVVFSAPGTQSGGLSVGGLPPGQAIAVWLRRTVNASSAAYSNDSVTVEGGGTDSTDGTTNVLASLSSRWNLVTDTGHAYAGLLKVDAYFPSLYNSALGSFLDKRNSVLVDSAATGVSAGPVVSGVPVQTPHKALVGSVQSGFSQYWYNTIHLNPNPMKLGNVVSVQAKTIEVWNAYLGTTVTLQQLTESNTSGITLTKPGAEPLAIAPLDKVTYGVSVGLSGPPTINASYTFKFDTGTITVPVTGARALAWAFEPDWSESVVERIEWKTNLLTSYNGTEQRIALRSQPRRSVSFKVQANAQERSYMQALTWGWQARVYAVPLVQYPQVLASKVTAGETVLTVTTTDYPFRSGGLAMLTTGALFNELVRVQSIAQGSITLASGVVNDWPAGARVYPVELGRMGTSLKVSNVTDWLAQAKVQFDLLDVPADTTVDGSTLYRNYAVSEYSWNWVDSVDDTYNRQLEVLDNLVGKEPVVDDPYGRPVFVMSRAVLLRNLSEINAFKQWLQARSGMAHPVWVPSGTEDIVVSGASGASATTLQIQNIGYASLYAAAIGRRDIKVVHRDGTVWYRRITGGSTVDANNEHISIDSSLGVAINPGDVHISFMALCRLNSDAVEIASVADGIAKVTLPMRVVPDDV